MEYYKLFGHYKYYDNKLKKIRLYIERTKLIRSMGESMGLNKLAQALAGGESDKLPEYDSLASKRQKTIGKKLKAEQREKLLTISKELPCDGFDVSENKSNVTMPKF